MKEKLNIGAIYITVKNVHLSAFLLKTKISQKISLFYFFNFNNSNTYVILIIIILVIIRYDKKMKITCHI